MATLAPGQFDDAPETTQDARGPAEEHGYIDSVDPKDLEWSEEEDEEEEELEEDYDDNRVEDEDWENAERDFTKQYNRLRQHAAVRTGAAEGARSATNTTKKVAALPAVNNPKHAAVSTVLSTSRDPTVDKLAAFAKYNSRLAKIDTPYVMGVGVNRKGPSAHANMKDKSDRATNEQVLDPRTRLILFKMIGRGLINEVNGCVSTGKEANVYHATTPEGKHLAVKIYKTSILVFKDRDKYVTGEHRFRRGYSRNPRKMVRLWAEKEMRNLKRLVAAGINTPEPLEVRENVLVMTFVGDSNGWASPRLKDASLPAEALSSLYSELLLTVRKMFHVCRLVHADLSEYNILYHQDHLWIIDVSQSVEHDHPSAFDFLRNDLKNVDEFFGRLGVKCLGLRKSFEFVTRECLSPGAESLSDEEVLRQWLEGSGADEDVDPETAAQDQEKAKEDAHHEDAVFLKSFIPRTLYEVHDPERDVERLAKGERNNLLYPDSIGVVPPVVGTKDANGPNDTDGAEQATTKTNVVRTDDAHGGEGEDHDDRQESENDTESEGDGDSPHETERFVERQPRGHRHENKDAKKERKRQVKEENKERRKQKMPKAEKKKLIKKTTSKAKQI